MLKKSFLKVALGTVLSAGGMTQARANEGPDSSFCQDLRSCISEAGKILHQSYLLSGDFKNAPVEPTPSSYELSTENAELFITDLLYQNGYTRVPTGEPGVFHIEKLKDALFSGLPVFTGDSRHKPELPPTWDVVTVDYTPRNPRLAAEGVRFLVDLLPRSGRVVALPSGHLIFTASARSLARVFELIDSYDGALSSSNGGARRASQHPN